MEMEPLTVQSITEFLASCYTIMLVTLEEHARLNASGFRSVMPHSWDGKDNLARYAAVGIDVAADQ